MTSPEVKNLQVPFIMSSQLMSTFSRRQGGPLFVPSAGILLFTVKETPLDEEKLVPLFSDLT